MIMASIAIHWFLVPRILAELVFPGKNKTVLNACKASERSQADGDLLFDSETMSRRSEMASLFVFVPRR